MKILERGEVLFFVQPRKGCFVLVIAISSSFLKQGYLFFSSYVSNDMYITQPGQVRDEPGVIFLFARS